MRHNGGMIRVAALDGFGTLLSRLGGDPDAVLQQAGVRQDLLQDEDNRMPFTCFLAALDIAARTTGHEEFGLLLSDLQKVGVLGPMLETLQSAPVLRTALDQLCRFIPTHDTATTVGWHATRDYASLSCLVLETETAGIDQHTDLAAHLGVHLLRGLMGQDFAPEMVMLPRRPPVRADVYPQLIGCPVVFGAGQFEIVFDSKWLDRPIVTANPAVHALLLQDLDMLLGNGPPDLVRQVKACIWRQLREGGAGLQDAASRMGLAPRTLQRELAGKNTSYRALLGEMRVEIAHRLRLHSGMNLTQIAAALGYSELSALSRKLRANSAN